MIRMLEQLHTSFVIGAGFGELSCCCTICCSSFWFEVEIAELVYAGWSAWLAKVGFFSGAAFLRLLCWKASRMSLKLDVVVFSVVVMMRGGNVGGRRSLGVAFFLLGSTVGRIG